MSNQDLYALLGVSRDASKDEIKKAYRTLAKKYHPDLNKGDAESEKRFKEVSAAYEVLKDEEKRAAYDRYGHAAFQQGGPGGGPEGFGDFSDVFSDLFRDFMGGGAGGQASSANIRGADLRYNLAISLDEAYKGKKTNIKFKAAVTCDSCDGSGSADGAEPMVCTTCGGAGRVRMQQGFFSIEKTCPACHGIGKVIKTPCKSCHGEGRVQKEKTLAVSIPAGVDDGTRIRLSGEGEVGIRGGSSGDLYVFVSVKPHDLFVRDGSDIHCKVPLSMTTAALGGSIEVPTIEGTHAKVSIPEGTQSGHQFRLRGKGMSILRSKNHGDMYIHAMVETPVNLNKKQKELLKSLEETMDEKSNPESEGFFKKVKEFWGKG